MAVNNNDGKTQDDLAKEFCVDKAATARTIQGMEKKEIASRIADTEDRRAKRVFLTEKAYQYQTQIENIQNKWVSICNIGMSEEELLFLIKISAMAEHVKSSDN